MIFGFLLDKRVTLVRFGETGRDRLDRPVLGEVSRTEGVPARLEQQGSVEGEEYVADKWRAFLPADVVLGSGDRLIEGGRTYAVDGSPELVGIPGFPYMSHVVAHLVIVGS